MVRLIHSRPPSCVVSRHDADSRPGRGGYACADDRAGPDLVARNGMVVAQEQRAARIGVEILERGGNAVDAAVAVGFALAVTYPRAGNIGGGGFMVIILARPLRMWPSTIARLRRQPPPRRCFWMPAAKPIPKKSRDSALSIGVPGTVAGLALAHEKYGSRKLSFAGLIAPAITLARNGVDVVDDIADTLPLAQARIARWPSSAPVFLNGTPYVAGQDLLQPDLAITLRAIASEGPKGFYEVLLRKKSPAAVRKSWRHHDDRRPEKLPRDRAHAAAGHLSRLRHHLDAAFLRRRSPDRDAEHSRRLRCGRARRRRAQSIPDARSDEARLRGPRGVPGDPDAVKMPIRGLLSKKYAGSLRRTIGDKATPASDIKPGRPDIYEGDNTTHFSVIDRDGNAVSNTYTLNFSYGVGLVAEGTGVLLNNEARRFYCQARYGKRIRVDRLRQQSARPAQASAVVHDSDHRAEGRQTGPRTGSPAAAVLFPRCCR